MDGILLAGHGSLRADSARTMGAVAEALRTKQTTYLIDTGFLNYGSPNVFETTARLVDRGVSQLTVQPYFLAAGQYVLQDLGVQVTRLRCQHPGTVFDVAPVLGEHPIILDMLQGKIRANMAGHGCQPDTFILVAHGSPYPEANQQIRRIASELKTRTRVSGIETAYLDLEMPDLASCCRLAMESGARCITVIPFFLHAGRHVMEDLPRILAKVRGSAPLDCIISLTSPLDDIELLAEVVYDHCVAGRQQSSHSPAQVASIQ